MYGVPNILTGQNHDSKGDQNGHCVAVVEFVDPVIALTLKDLLVDIECKDVTEE